MRIKNCISFILFALCFISCQTRKEGREEDKPKFETGTLVNNTYKNKFFNLQLSIPEGWDIQNKEEVKQIMNEGKEMVSKEISDMAEAADSNAHDLLAVFKYDTNSAQEFNPNFMMIAEDLRGADIEIGATYLYHAKQMLEKTGVDYTYLNDEFKYKIINGEGYHIMDVEWELEGYPVKQSYMATVKNGYALIFIYTYDNEEQKNELEKVINSMKPYKIKKHVN